MAHDIHELTIFYRIDEATNTAHIEMIKSNGETISVDGDRESLLEAGIESIIKKNEYAHN